MSLPSPFVAGSAGIAGFVFASFGEYVIHRLMHRGRGFAARHRRHHKAGDAQGVWGEFVDYYQAAPLCLWWGFLISVPAGLGWATGMTLYGFFAAYAHQLQHERPELVFWMPRPIHYLHHRHNLWRTNYGIAVDWWDRLLGTYESIEWRPSRRPFEHPLRDFFAIGWRRRGGFIAPSARPPVGAESVTETTDYAMPFLDRASDARTERGV